MTAEPARQSGAETVHVGRNGAGGPLVAQLETPVPDGRWRRLAYAAGSGLLLSASFPSLDVTPLAWIGLVPLLLATHGRSVRSAFALGWVAGMTFFLATCYWIVHTISHYTPLPTVVCVVLLVAMSAVLACYHGAFAAGLRFFERRGLPALWLAPALWVTLEWVRGWFFIGFPWAALGYSQWRFSNLVQIVEVTGVYGVSAVLVLFNVVVAGVLRERGRGVLRVGPPLAVLTILVGVLPAVGAWRKGQLAAMPPAGRVTVAVAQGNVEQDRKWDPAFQAETMARYATLTREAARLKPDLVVWPETAAPFFFQEPSPWRQDLLELVREVRIPLLFGSPAFRVEDGRIEQLNRAFLLGPDGSEQGTYDKIQLVPFGEYVPFRRILFFVPQIVTAVGQIGAGIDPTVFTIPQAKLGTLICYEGIFPELPRRFVDAGAQVLVNITNDAWFGRTSAPWQHLVQESFRAIENRTPMVRAANTGISAFIDATGHIRWASPLYETLWYVDEVTWPGVKTFYAQYGNVFVWACAAVLVAFLGVGARRRAG
ncbi:MAG: apolipoprotein N-acyltransferase [bacterium]|nr:apolipoprotein N-acyltransferase [bacterium]